MTSALRDIKSPTVEIACESCGHSKHFRVSYLITKRGPDAMMPDVRHELSADCPHREAGIRSRCNPYYPALAKQR